MIKPYDILVPPHGLRILAPLLGETMKSRRIVRKPGKNRCAFLLTDTTDSLHDVATGLSQARSKGMQVSTLVLYAGVGDIQLANAFIETFQGQYKLKHTFLANDPAVIKRLVFAQEQGAQQQLIASASVSGDELLVWSCEPRLYRIPLAKLPTLAKLSIADQRKFTLSASGSRLHWEKQGERHDFDLDLESLLYPVDPRVRARVDLRRQQDLRSFAAGIAAVRKRRGLRQDQCGISEREMRRIEKGERLPHLRTLEKLARAHDSEIDVYLDDVAKAVGSAD